MLFSLSTGWIWGQILFRSFAVALRAMAERVRLTRRLRLYDALPFVKSDGENRRIPPSRSAGGRRRGLEKRERDLRRGTSSIISNPVPDARLPGGIGENLASQRRLQFGRFGPAGPAKTSRWLTPPANFWKPALLRLWDQTF